MDDIIRRMRATDPTDIEATVAVCTEALQLLLEELPSFPTYGYSGFMTWDEFYWTNWPGSENPYMGPLRTLGVPSSTCCPSCSQPGK